MRTQSKVLVRELGPADAEGVSRIAARHDAVAPSLVADVALGAEVDGRLVGFLTGDVRTVEFGSERCGWILALGVDPDAARRGAGRALLEEGCRRFRVLGVRHLRTMVRRNVVPVLSLFRSCGFVGGPFTQMELDLLEEPGPARAGGAAAVRGNGDPDGTGARNGTPDGTDPARAGGHVAARGARPSRGHGHGPGAGPSRPGRPGPGEPEGGR